MHGSVLVTGGFGNLGSWITKYLLEKNFKVYVLTRSKAKSSVSNLMSPNLHIVEADITDRSLLAEKLDFDLDFCIHAASYNEFYEDDYPSKALLVNSLGTRNILDVLSKKNLKHFVYLSTFHVYGVTSGYISELTPTIPINDYASTHLFGEYYVRQFGLTSNLKFSILRLTNSYGAPFTIDTDKWYLILNDLTRSAFESGNVVLKSNGQIQKDFIYMGDVVDSIYKLLLVEPKNEIFNISYGRSKTLLGLAQTVKRVFRDSFSKDIDIIVNSSDEVDYENLVVSNDKLAKFIDFKPRDYIDNEIVSIINLLEDSVKS